MDINKRKRAFSISAIAGAVFTAMFAGPSGRAAQYGRIDLEGDDGKKLMKTLDGIEANLESLSKKATGEIETLGKVSKETNEGLEKVGKMQLELADRLQKLEQKGSAQQDDKPRLESIGSEFVKSAAFKSFVDGAAPKARFEIDTAKLKNTVLEGAGSATNALVPIDRRPGIIRGPFRNLKLESVLNSADTTSNAIAYTKELSFTNAAAETAEGATKPQSDITFSLVTQPVQTIAHWIKISRQLSKDAPALTAYINTRMMYGVNKRAEDQIIQGNGVDPNIAGLLASGNYTAHGYTSSSLGTVNPKLKLIRRVIADLATSDYPADVVLLNPSDWADLELLTDTQGRYLIGNPLGSADAQPLWGLTVVASNAVPVGTVIVMSQLAATVYNREGVIVELSESDSDNFTRNLITVRAERRLMLAVEIPAAIRAGSLSPA